MKRILCLLLALLFLPAAFAEEDFSIEETVLLSDDGEEIILFTTDDSADAVKEETEIVVPAMENEAREDFIDRIIALGKELYTAANGRRQRAHYSSDIYVCKNFTTYLFRKCRDDFQMAEYPGTQLVIPNNLKAAKCKPYSYGFYWEEVAASKGNPFEVGAQFHYDAALSYDENLALAVDFMKQAQKGDFMQMSAKYEYGTGAHSAIIIADYDAENNAIHWMDSNMLGGSYDGIRYGYVQWDAVNTPEWWAKAFCHKTRGATLYRLRTDIEYR